MDPTLTSLSSLSSSSSSSQLVTKTTTTTLPTEGIPSSSSSSSSLNSSTRNFSCSSSHTPKPIEESTTLPLSFDLTSYSSFAITDTNSNSSSSSNLPLFPGPPLQSNSSPSSPTLFSYPSCATSTSTSTSTTDTASSSGGSLSPTKLSKVQSKLAFQIHLELFLKEKEIATIKREILKAQHALSVLKKLKLSGEYDQIVQQYHTWEQALRPSLSSSSSTSSSTSSPPSLHALKNDASLSPSSKLSTLTPSPSPISFSQLPLEKPFNSSSCMSTLTNATSTPTPTPTPLTTLSSCSSSLSPKKKLKRHSISSTYTSTTNNTSSSSTKKEPPSALYARRNDGVYVKLACSICQRTQFTNLQGLINHCRMAHQLEFASHEEANWMCGTPVPESDIPLNHPARRKWIEKLAPTHPTFSSSSSSLLTFEPPSTSSSSSSSFTTTTATTSLPPFPSCEPVTSSTTSPSATPCSSLPITPLKQPLMHQHHTPQPLYAIEETRFHFKKLFRLGSVSQYLLHPSPSSPSLTTTNTALPSLDSCLSSSSSISSSSTTTTPPTNIDSHQWMIYLKPNSFLDSLETYITCMRIFLHSSYAPHHIVDIVEPPFQLIRTGWGEFSVRVQIFFVDHEKNKPWEHVFMLKLDKSCSGQQVLGYEHMFEIDFDKSSDFTKRDFALTSTSSSSTVPMPITKRRRTSSTRTLLKEKKKESQRLLRLDPTTHLLLPSNPTPSLPTETSFTSLPTPKKEKENEENEEDEEEATTPSISSLFPFPLSSPLFTNTLVGGRPFLFKEDVFVFLEQLITQVPLIHSEPHVFHTPYRMASSLKQFQSWSLHRQKSVEWIRAKTLHALCFPFYYAKQHDGKNYNKKSDLPKDLSESEDKDKDKDKDIVVSNSLSKVHEQRPLCPAFLSIKQILEWCREKKFTPPLVFSSTAATIKTSTTKSTSSSSSSRCLIRFNTPCTKKEKDQNENKGALLDFQFCAKCGQCSHTVLNCPLSMDNLGIFPPPPPTMTTTTTTTTSSSSSSSSDPFSLLTSLPLHPKFMIPSFQTWVFTHLSSSHSLPTPMTTSAFRWMSLLTYTFLKSLLRRCFSVIQHHKSQVMVPFHVYCVLKQHSEFQCLFPSLTSSFSTSFLSSRSLSSNVSSNAPSIVHTELSSSSFSPSSSLFSLSSSSSSSLSSSVSSLSSLPSSSSEEIAVGPADSETPLFMVTPEGASLENKQNDKQDEKKEVDS